MKNSPQISEPGVGFEKFDVFFIETNLDGIITYANDAFVKISGFTIDKLIGKNLNVFHPDMPQWVFDEQIKTIRSGHPWQGFVNIHTKSDKIFWVHATVSPIVRSGQIIGYLSLWQQSPKNETWKEKETYPVSPPPQAFSFGRWFGHLRLQTKLYIMLQSVLLIGGFIATFGVYSQMKSSMLSNAQRQAESTSMQVIDTANLLMVTGEITTPENRKLMIHKIVEGQRLQSLRLVRTEQVVQQFGPGLPEEHLDDPVVRQTIENAVQQGRPIPYFSLEYIGDKPVFRAITPYLESHNFHGTDCLTCHNVQVGSSNGASDMVIDLTENFNRLRTAIVRLIAEQVALQVFLFFFIAWVGRRFVTRPITNVKNHLVEIVNGDYYRPLDISGRDEMGELLCSVQTTKLLLGAAVNQTKEKLAELGIAAVAFNSQEGIIVTDSQQIILKVNDAFTAVTGYTSEEALGKTPAILQSGRQDKEFYRRMRETLDRDKYWQGEIWNRRKNGEIYPEWLTITPVVGEDGNTCYVGIFSDITQRKAYEEKISFLAYHDPLTKLPSRELFYDRLSRAMSQARRNQDCFALLFLDLDGFKSVNDHYGHEAGDEVLKSTASRLLACIRDIDTVARLGGDEFAIILGGMEKTIDVTSVAEKIIQTLSEPILIQRGGSCIIGVSIGVAIYPNNGVEIDRLMSAADSAMYESKEAGKNTYTISRMNAEDADKQDWVVFGSPLLVGVPEIDQEHLELVNLLNKLNAAVKKADSIAITTSLFDEFVEKIATHFKAEERLMDRYGDPDSHAHITEHQRLISEVEHLRERFLHGRESHVLQALKDWLLNHIMGSDRALGQFITQHGKM